VFAATGSNVLTSAGQCARCGYQNSAEHRFCGSCGQALGAEDPAAAALEGERRWATVLFADLSGFTSHSEVTDPEEVRWMVDRLTGKIGEIVRTYGGWVDKVIGDAVMAVFGAPVAHEDDAERAVRAALELQRYATENADELAGLALRVGLDSGEVMFAPVGPRERREFTVMGDAVNTASRLQGAAPKGGVLIGERTTRACGQAIRCEAVKPVRLKGKEAPVNAWLAREAVAPPAQRPVSEGSMVGRTAELEALCAAWNRVAARLEPRLVTVLGPAGIGKTRLCRELARVAEHDGGRVIAGRSLPYGESTGYAALADVIRTVAGIYESDPRIEARQKLARRLELLPDLEQPHEVLAHLALLLGLTEEAVDDRTALFVSVQSFVEALARERSTLLVIEDIHWADRGLLDLIEWLGAHVSQGRLMVVASARADLLDSRPDWASRVPGHVQLRLDPLAADESRELALRLLRDLPDPDLAADQIMETAGGNPLFVEELTAAFAEGAADPASHLPVAIRSIIAARLDALPADERHVLLYASVVGNIFWPSVVECLAGDDARVATAVLDDLELRDLIRRQRSSRMQGEDEYAFKHGLIRDVAYATLPRAARREHHAAVAAFLEDAAGFAADSAAILAYHWRAAGDADRALEYLLAAAEQAGRGWAKEEAVALYNQALALLPDGDRRTRGIQLKRAVAWAALTHVAARDVERPGSPPTAMA
jgi:class 3 adenylate cyclase/energy-coupling factor transporter ATP-binding protein EcfA2